jgi:hypothetical protein
VGKCTRVRGSKYKHFIMAKGMLCVSKVNGVMEEQVEGNVKGAILKNVRRRRAWDANKQGAMHGSIIQLHWSLGANKQELLNCFPPFSFRIFKCCALVTASGAILATFTYHVERLEAYISIWEPTKPRRTCTSRGIKHVKLREMAQPQNLSGWTKIES